MTSSAQRFFWLIEKLGVKRLTRIEALPVSFGFPFGLTLGIPPNLPMPSKIETPGRTTALVTTRSGRPSLLKSAKASAVAPPVTA